MLRILKYVEIFRARGWSVEDECSNPILKDEQLTFAKYRISNIKKKKEQTRQEVNRSSLISNRLHMHLYSLREGSELDSRNS